MLEEHSKFLTETENISTFNSNRTPPKDNSSNKNVNTKSSKINKSIKNVDTKSDIKSDNQSKRNKSGHTTSNLREMDKANKELKEKKEKLYKENEDEDCVIY